MLCRAMLCYDMVLGRMHTLRGRMLMISRIYRDVWAVVGRLLCLVDAYCVMYGRICTKVYCLWTLTTNGECTLIIYVFACTNPTQIRTNTCCTLCMHTKHGGRLDTYRTAPFSSRELHKGSQLWVFDRLVTPAFLGHFGRSWYRFARLEELYHVTLLLH